MELWSIRQPVPYAEGSELQRKLVEARAAGSVGDVLLFLEHEPVITRGRGLQRKRNDRYAPASGVTSVTPDADAWTGRADAPRAMPLGPLPPGIAFAESERGGDLTYHGPGQLVVYPIVKLDGRSRLAPKHDVAAFLRAVESGVVSWLGGLGLRASSRPDATGVWVEPGASAGGAPGSARKIASLGIAVRKWVTWHGLAVNVVNDLASFRLMSPCGFDPEVMIRLKDLLPADRPEVGAESWRAECEAGLGRVFSALGDAGAEARTRSFSSIAEAARALGERSVP